jgi:hypothetical protein
MPAPCGPQRAARTLANSIRRASRGIMLSASLNSDRSGAESAMTLEPTDEPYDVRTLQATHIEQLYGLHQEVLALVPHPHILRRDTREFLLGNICGTGRTFGAFCGPTLVGYASVAFPGRSERNLAYDLPHLAIDPEMVAIYDGSAVHPDHRGRGLQTLLNDHRSRFASSAGFRHFMGTVSPLNPYSLVNHLRAGFFVKALTFKYGGMIRYIIHKDLRSRPAGTPNVIDVEFGDLELQKRALADGLWGSGLRKHTGTWTMQYGRFNS